MTWASVILALIKAIGALTTWATNEKLISAGQAMAAAKALKEQHDALERANAIREGVRGDLAKHPDSVMRDDGFRRD